MFNLIALGYYQGKMYRRESDIFPGMGTYRPVQYIDGWFTADIKAAYKVSAKAEIGISIKNVLDTERYFIKNNAYLFDYRLDGRGIIGEITVNFKKLSYGCSEMRGS